MEEHSTPDLQSPAVLLVDDTPANLFALSAVLKPLGARLVEARSGAEALEHIAREPFAAVLLDVQMPEMDGFEAATKLRGLPHGKEVPILFLTAIHRDERYAKKGYQVGAADYVTKPFDADVLRARVKAFVDLYAQREQVRREQVALRTRERDDAVRRLVAFEHIARATLESSDLKSLLGELLRIFMTATDDADSAMILLRDGDKLVVQAAIEGGKEIEERFSLSIGEGFAGKIASERAPFELADAARSPLVKSTWLRSRDTKALYGVPLLSDGEVLGVAHVGSTRVDAFSENDKRLFFSIADRAAWAVAKQISRERMFDVLAGVPAVFAVLRVPSLEIEHTNAAFRELFGGRDMVGKRATDLEVGGPGLDVVRKAYVTGQTISLDEMVGNFPVGPRVMRFTAQPLRNHAGTVDRVLTFAVDVTAQVAAREEVEAQRAERQRLLEREHAARAEAELASRAKDEFLATVSHELRTPLNAILGYAVMARPKASPEVERALAVIERNARAQSRMIEDVLDISRIVSGKLRLESGHVDVQVVVQAAVEALKPAAEAKNVSISLAVDDVPRVSGDGERLQQIVTNLVSNAIKFTPAKGRVKVDVTSSNGNVDVRVSDTGEGIEPEFLPHVFDPFRQADGSSARRHGGLGLGLAIVKQLVQAHGGSVHAESPGKGLGATFCASFPTAQDEGLTPRPSSRPRDRVRLDGLRVLCVDDDDDARILLRDLLAERGAEVALAASAHEGFSLFERFRPDVIVSDIAMPGGDGYGLIRAIRGLPAERGARTPAIAVTAHAREQDGERAFAAGFQSHMSKPVDIARLVNLVANLGGMSFAAGADGGAASSERLVVAPEDDTAVLRRAAEGG